MVEKKILSKFWLVIVFVTIILFVLISNGSGGGPPRQDLYRSGKPEDPQIHKFFDLCSLQ